MDTIRQLEEAREGMMTPEREAEIRSWVKRTSRATITDYARDLLAELDRVRVERDEESAKAERAEAALREARDLPAKWRDAAVWEHEEMSNTQSGQTFDQCADELDAALAGTEPAPEKEQS